MRVIKCKIDEDWNATIDSVIRLAPDWVVLRGGKPDELRCAVDKLNLAGIPSLRSSFEPAKREAKLQIFEGSGSPHVFSVRIGKDWPERLRTVLRHGPDYVILTGKDKALLNAAAERCNLIGCGALCVLDGTSPSERRHGHSVRKSERTRAHAQASMLAG